MARASKRPPEQQGRPAQIAEIARDYYTAAKRLFDSSASDIGPFRSAFFTLVAFSLELSFKAALSAAGYEEERLMAIGHDLQRAFEKAAECGLYEEEDCGMDIPVLVRSLHANHLMHAFRYPMNVPTVHVPHPVLALRALARQIELMERFVFPMPGSPLWQARPERG